MTKDQKVRSWLEKPENLRPLFEKTYQSLLEGGFGSAVKTEEDRRRVTCKVLSNGLWGNFVDPAHNLSYEEIYEILFG